MKVENRCKSLWKISEKIKHLQDLFATIGFTEAMNEGIINNCWPELLVGCEFNDLKVKFGAKKDYFNEWIMKINFLSSFEGESVN